MPSRSRGIRILLTLLVVAIVGGAVGLGVVYFTLLRDLPEMESVAEYHPPLTSLVLDRKGRLIGEFYDERRRLVAYEDVPRHTVLAFVAGEDASFFEHEGIDYMGILRAAWVNLAAGGEVKQGGSTITQQTVKGLLLTPERKIQRKIKELILARRLEQQLSKEDILYLYLNQIYFGQGAWGIEEAARTYFGKPASELGVSESALLAGLPQRPSDYSPTSNPRAAERRRRYVLQRMRVEGFIDEETFRSELESPPELKAPEDRVDARGAAYFVEEVRRRLYDTIGSELVLRGGITVTTTLDLDLQREATQAIRGGLEQLDRRQGWRGPESTLAVEMLGDAIIELGKLNELVATVEAPIEDDPEVAEALAAMTPEPPSEPEPVAIPTDTPLRGVVLAVNPKEKTARVAFAPEVEATVRLADVRWARKPDPSKRAHSMRAIEQIFQVGQAASFRILADDADLDGAAAPGRVLYAELNQSPLAEGALLSFDIKTGDVRALVGGYDYRRSEFDRATQARRQAGSAFKPLIYAAALERDYTPASILVDRPVVYEDPDSGFVWRPQNYSRKFLGRLPMRTALARSVNNATIHLFRDLRTNNVIEFARRVGIESPLARDLSLALGSSSVTLLEMTRAYAVFASGGEQVLPTFITAVHDREGEAILGTQILGTVPEVEEWRPKHQAPEDAELAQIVKRLEAGAPGEEGNGPAHRTRVISPQLAYLASDLLRAAVFDPKGTGRGARELGRKVGGKTGTTNFGGDAWFIGFSPDVVTGVWVGYDEKRVLGKGETGGRTALPIWRDYMKHALKEHPNRDFAVPSGIVFTRVDPATGLLAAAGSKDAYLQGFAEGTEPTQTAKQASRGREGGRLLRLDEF
ncbi:MAG: PBP1A family penicillin-binding protein [Deltaproteobacteria bacterium]|nr:PBP1A family penicillin-binding protein [Deltaproteobacteria bacterium]MBW2444541.1 PBP1A family penicillin-binding protein [Deltaproteobacteria bacterium]